MRRLGRFDASGPLGDNLGLRKGALRTKKRKKAMHFIVSWDINAEGEEWDALNAQLKECIENYSWARPLSTFYVVRVSAPQEWQEITKDLIKVAEGSPIRIHLVIGPLMSGGQYDGYLPKDFWPELEKRIA